VAPGAAGRRVSQGASHGPGLAWAELGSLARQVNASWVCRLWDVSCQQQLCRERERGTGANSLGFPALPPAPAQRGSPRPGPAAHRGGRLPALPSLTGGIEYCTPETPLSLSPSLHPHGCFWKGVRGEKLLLGMSQPEGIAELRESTRCREGSFPSTPLPSCVGGTETLPTAEHRATWPCRTPKGETRSNPGLVARPRAPVGTTAAAPCTQAPAASPQRHRAAHARRARFPPKPSGLVGPPVLGSPCPRHQRVSSAVPSLRRDKGLSSSRPQPKAGLQSPARHRGVDNAGVAGHRLLPAEPQLLPGPLARGFRGFCAWRGRGEAVGCVRQALGVRKRCSVPRAAPQRRSALPPRGEPGPAPPQAGTGSRHRAPGEGTGSGHREWAPGVGTRRGHGERAPGVGTGRGHREWAPGVGTGHREKALGEGTGRWHREWALGVGTGSGHGSVGSGQPGPSTQRRTEARRPRGSAPCPAEATRGCGHPVRPCSEGREMEVSISLVSLSREGLLPDTRSPRLVFYQRLWGPGGGDTTPGASYGHREPAATPTERLRGASWASWLSRESGLPTAAIPQQAPTAPSQRLAPRARSSPSPAARALKCLQHDDAA